MQIAEIKIIFFISYDLIIIIIIIMTTFTPIRSDLYVKYDEIHFETCHAGELFSGRSLLSQKYQCHGITTVSETNVRRIRVPRSERLSDCHQWRLSHRSAFLFYNPDVTFTINLRRRGLLSTTRDIHTYIHTRTYIHTCVHVSLCINTCVPRKDCDCNYNSPFQNHIYFDSSIQNTIL